MGVLEALASELGIQPEWLRSRLDTPSPDSAQSAYIAAQPDGTINATFQGNVQLNAAPNYLAQQPANKVMWVRQSDGAEVGFITTDYVPGAGTGSRLDLNAKQMAAGELAEVTVGAQLTGPGGGGALLIDQAGNSDFVFAYNQTPPTASHRWRIGPVITLAAFNIGAQGGAQYIVDTQLPSAGYTVVGAMLEQAAYNSSCITWAWNNYSGTQILLSFVNPTGAARNTVQWRGCAIGYG